MPMLKYLTTIVVLLFLIALNLYWMVMNHTIFYNLFYSMNTAFKFIGVGMAAIS